MKKEITKNDGFSCFAKGDEGLKRRMLLLLVNLWVLAVLTLPASAAVNFNALDYQSQNGGQFDFRRWSQDQLPWGAEVLGADTAEYRYGGFGAAGCLITALAKIAVQSGQYTIHDMNPSIANERALQFTNNNGAINDWSKAAAAFGFIMERNIAPDSILDRLQQNPNLQFILGVNENGGSGISHYVPINNTLSLSRGALYYDDSWGAGSTQYKTKAECDASYQTLTFKSSNTSPQWRYEQYGEKLVGQAWPSNSVSGRYYCKIVYMFTPVGRPAGDVDADTLAFAASATAVNAVYEPKSGLSEARIYARPSVFSAVRGHLTAGESVIVAQAGSNSGGVLFYRIGEGEYADCYLYSGDVCERLPIGFDSLTAADVDSDRATLSCTLSLKEGSIPTETGLLFGTAENSLLRLTRDRVSDTPPTALSYGTADLSLILDPLTTYYYAFYAILDGKEYRSGTASFQTTHVHTYTAEGWDAVHPHKTYRACTCGARSYTDGTQTVPFCQYCVPVTAVSLSPQSACLPVGGMMALFCEILPAEAPNRSVVWNSSDPQTVTIQNGLIVAQAPGIGDISATTVDGGFADACRVCVLADLPDVSGDGEVNVLDALILHAASESEYNAMYGESDVQKLLASITGEGE